MRVLDAIKTAEAECRDREEEVALRSAIAVVFHVILLQFSTLLLFLGVRHGSA